MTRLEGYRLVGVLKIERTRKNHVRHIPASDTQKEAFVYHYEFKNIDAWQEYTRDVKTGKILKFENSMGTVYLEN